MNEFFKQQPKQFRLAFNIIARHARPDVCTQSSFFLDTVGRTPTPTSLWTVDTYGSHDQKRTQEPFYCPVINVFLLLRNGLSTAAFGATACCATESLPQHEEKAQVLTSNPNSLGFIAAIKMRKREHGGGLIRSRRDEMFLVRGTRGIQTNLCGE